MQNNLIYGNQAYGIQIAGYVSLSNILVQNNTIASEQNAGGIVIWQAGAKGCVIQNNTVMNNAGYGLDFFDDGGGHVVQNNTFYGNAAGGIDPSMSAQYTGSNNLVGPRGRVPFLPPFFLYLRKTFPARKAASQGSGSFRKNRGSRTSSRSSIEAKRIDISA